MAKMNGILWCAGQGGRVDPFFQQYGWSSRDAMQLIRQKYLSARCAPEWWPMEFCPVAVPVVEHWYMGRNDYFCPVYFEDELVALLLGRRVEYE
jgi:hypothetical protein